MAERAWAVLLALLICSAGLTMEQSSNGISGSGDDTSSNKTTLRILIIAPFPDKMFEISYDGGNNLIPSALMAVSEINDDPSILADYELEPVIGDGGCSVTEKAVSSVLENVIHRGKDKNIIGIAGPVCSEATRVLSTLANQNRIRLPIVTIGTSPILANSTRYPFTFGILSTAVEYAGTFVTVLSEKLRVAKQWDRIAIFYDGTREYHSRIYMAVLEEIESKNLGNSTKVYGFPISETYMPLENLIEFRTRVAFVLASKGPACRLMCLAFHMKMTHPTYQFIFTDRTFSNFQGCDDFLNVSVNSEHYVCTIDDIVRTIKGFILFTYNLESLALQPNTTQAVSGYTYSEYRQRYEQRLYKYNGTLAEEILKPTAWAAPLYDAVWAVALAANQTLPNLDFNSRLGIWDEEQLNSTFYGINFRGISTMVNFKAHSGFSHSTINIYYVENETTCVLVGHYDAGTLFNDGEHDSNTSVLELFIESSFATSTETIPSILWISGYVLAALVLVVTITFHALHLVYRKRPSLKASSPTLNNFIFFGCYVLLGSVLLDSTVFAVSPQNNSTYLLLCYVVVWLENIGTTFVFSTLFVKYYRLYLVFLKTYDHRSNLSNGKLTLLAMGFVAIDVVILAVWTPLKPLEVITKVNLDTSTETPIYREIKICQTTELGRWFPASTSLYLAVLILAVVTLSILNRRIKQRAFNTTLATNALVYVYIFLLSIALPVVYIEKNADNIQLQYGILNLLYLTFVVLCNIFLFTPPLLLKNRRNRKYSLAQTMRRMTYIIALSKIQEHDSTATT